MLNEQLGQPSCQSGPNIKWYTTSWLLPANRSAILSFPLGPSKVYSFAPRVHGSSRRCRLSSSRMCVSSFSLRKSSFRAASHSASDTTFGPSFARFDIMFLLELSDHSRFFHSRAINDQGVGRPYSRNLTQPRLSVMAPCWF